MYSYYTIISWYFRYGDAFQNDLVSWVSIAAFLDHHCFLSCRLVLAVLTYDTQCPIFSDNLSLPFLMSYQVFLKPGALCSILQNLRELLELFL